ncbi:MAG TPA: hypothetical protein VK031_08135 [Tissierellaceae bacterium]|nr:hypothetical protein [Tissierellaceae bacterium]
MSITYENSAKEITLGQAIDAHKHGIAVIVNDGRDITVVIEKEPTTDQVK